MPWVKLDDKFRTHPKVIAADLEAAWFYVCALGYCAEQLTDGEIGAGMVPILAPHVTDPSAAAEKCCTVGLLERTDTGYRVPDYLDYNPPRAKVLADREAAKARRTRSSSADVRANVARTSSEPPETFAGRSATPYPYPYPESVDNQPSSEEPGRPSYPQPVDGGSVAEAVLDYLVDVAQAGNREPITKPERWRRTVRRRLLTEHGDTVNRLAATWPTAPASAIGNAVIDGDTRQLARYPQDVPA